MFRSNEETEQLLFIVEQYIGKPLSATEVRTILFIYDKLGFSADLIDYLVQYCVGKRKSFRYIEKVAVEWAENHITTPRQAKEFACKYDKNVYQIMKALGKKNISDSERSHLYHPVEFAEWGFSPRRYRNRLRTNRPAVDKHRFAYADSILASWFQSQVHSVEDIRAIDAAYQKRSLFRASTLLPFHQFIQSIPAAGL